MGLCSGLTSGYLCKSVDVGTGNYCNGVSRGRIFFYMQNIGVIGFTSAFVSQQGMFQTDKNVNPHSCGGTIGFLSAVVYAHFSCLKVTELSKRAKKVVLSSIYKGILTAKLQTADYADVTMPFLGIRT